MADKIHPHQVRTESEQLILGLGGRVLEGLPLLDRTRPRLSAAAADRALVMNAMLQLYFGAPIGVVSTWVEANSLRSVLCHREQELLAAKDELTKQQRVDLYWYLEALWALMWAGQQISTLSLAEPVGDALASLLPDLRVNERGDAFRQRFSLRPFDEIYQMLDLYYRAHWFARDGQLRGLDTGIFSIDIIMERRKALEWIADADIEHWDETPDHT